MHSSAECARNPEKNALFDVALGIDGNAGRGDVPHAASFRFAHHSSTSKRRMLKNGP
jgi:hypothetical protein